MRYSVLSKIIANIIKDWKECDVCDECTMTRMAYISRRFSNFIIALYAISVFLYATGTLMKYKSNNQTDTRELILKMELPFEIKSTSVHIVVLITQFVHQTSAASMVGVINSLLLTSIIHICGQIDILREWLANIFSKKMAGSMDEITMRSLIIKHQRIIIFAENIENLYTYIALMMLLSDTLIICCLGFIIVTSLDTPNAAAILVKSVLFYITINLEAFIYCFSGEYLSAKSKMIGNAAYDSLWYNFPAKQSRIVLFLIVRSQKRLTITSGKIVDLSLEQFTSVIKASLSYISVLLAMY
ncbi:odorant receptor 22c-like [Pogonomyrmex barbatus]|uniref:Odorant receptor 22c-like n=1 Tax=Pogonomyrmex barbatus TaxID=144034 RepID=A0A8N1S2U8_9HYME|nr:odorant receptor 22c-like [Pogonomyrmex barbatus]